MSYCVQKQAALAAGQRRKRAQHGVDRLETCMTAQNPLEYLVSYFLEQL